MQHYSSDPVITPAEEEAEGERLRALFQADINQRTTKTTQHKDTALKLLLDAYPVLSSSRREFIDKSSTYANRKDLKAKYSARQITAYAAAEILTRELDILPHNFHGIFTVCCVVAETHAPTKKST